MTQLADSPPDDEGQLVVAPPSARQDGLWADNPRRAMFTVVSDWEIPSNCLPTDCVSAHSSCPSYSCW